MSLPLPENTSSQHRALVTRDGRPGQTYYSSKPYEYARQTCDRLLAILGADTSNAALVDAYRSAPRTQPPGIPIPLSEIGPAIASLQALVSTVANDVDAVTEAVGGDVQTQLDTVTADLAALAVTVDNMVANLGPLPQEPTPGVPQPGTVYSLCYALYPLGTYQGQNYDTSGWQVTKALAVIGTWYGLNFSNCDAFGFVTDPVTGGMTATYDGYYLVTLTWGGNVSGNRIPVIQLAVTTDDAAPVLENPLTSVAGGQPSSLEIPFNLTGSWMVPMVAGETLRPWIKVVAGGTGDIDILTYRVSMYALKV